MWDYSVKIQMKLRLLFSSRQITLYIFIKFHEYLERFKRYIAETISKLVILYHVFIDFEKGFDRVWHAALWATMQRCNISAYLVCTSEQLYDKATSAVQMNGSIGEWFRTTVGVRQRCLLSPTLFNIFLERVMSDCLEEHDREVSIGGRNITNLRFFDDIDALAFVQAS